MPVMMKSITGWNARTAGIKRINFTHMETNITPVEQQAPQVLEHDYDIDAFLEKRKEFIEKVNAIMVQGADYHVIKDKKSLGKGGAEKIASIFGWTATFTKDEDVAAAFTEVKGLISFVCHLQKSGVPVGEGRGAATLTGNGNDPNKTIKMAQKSAFIDAVLRASGLSDFFTQDLEDMAPQNIGTTPASDQGQNSSYRPPQQATGSFSKPSDKQLKLIRDLMEQKGYSVGDIMDQGFSPLEQLTGGKGGTASELIDFLFKAKTKQAPNGLPVIDVNDDRVPFDDEGIGDNIPL